MAELEYDKCAGFVNSVHAPGRSLEFLSLCAMASEPFSSSLRLPSPAAQKPAAAWGEGRAKEAAGMDQQDSNRYNQGDPEQTRKLDEKYCQSCGEIIKMSAEVCHGCGARQKGMVNKAVLFLLTFEELYFVENNKYTSDLTILQLARKTPFVRIDIISADKNCFEARLTHAKLHKSVAIDCYGLDQYPGDP